MNEREQFEAFVFKKWGITGYGLRQAADGSYIRWQVDYAWDAWQARAALAASPVPAEAAALLRGWQTCLGPSRESCDDQGRRVWDRIDAALAASPVPAGHWIAPDEPTEEMLRAGWNAYLADMKGGLERFAKTYRAMREIAVFVHAAKNAPAPTMLNGLTESETLATASVAGLSAPAQQAERAVAALRGALSDANVPIDLRAPIIGMFCNRWNAATAPSVEAQADAWQLLTDLVDALDRTNWSSWQTTHRFQEQLDAARAALKEPQQ